MSACLCLYVSVYVGRLSICLFIYVYPSLSMFVMSIVPSIYVYLVYIFYCPKMKIKYCNNRRERKLKS